MDSSGKLQYTVEYSTSFSDDIVTKAYVDNVIKSYRDYNDYLATQVQNSVSYMEYLAGKLDETIGKVDKLDEICIKKSVKVDTFFNDITFEDY